MKILLWAPLGAGEHYWGPGTSAYRLYASNPSSDIVIDLAHGFKHQNDPRGLFRSSYFISNLGGGGVISTLYFLIKSWFFVQKHHKEYDVIHCLGAFEISFRPALWFTKRGKRVFCKITDEKGGIVGHSSFSRFFGIAKMRKRQLNNLSGYIAISTEIVEILENAGVKESKIFKIPNGVNINQFKPVENLQAKFDLRVRNNLDPSLFVVLFVGGISSRKQPFELVKLFGQMVKENVDKKLHLVLLGPDRSGKEDLLANINKYIKQNHLEDRITHYDHVSTPEEFYQLADVFVLPSLSEGMSNAALEALACGLPAIVTPVSGMKDLVVDQSSGFIDQIGQFSSKIKYYFLNKKVLDQHALYAREYMVANFSSEKVLQTHLDIFRNEKL